MNANTTTPKATNEHSLVTFNVEQYQLLTELAYAADRARIAAANLQSQLADMASRMDDGLVRLTGATRLAQELDTATARIDDRWEQIRVAWRDLRARHIASEVIKGGTVWLYANRTHAEDGRTVTIDAGF